MLTAAELFRLVAAEFGKQVTPCFPLNRAWVEAVANAIQRREVAQQTDEWKKLYDRIVTPSAN